MNRIDIDGMRYQHGLADHGIQPCTVVLASTGEPSRCDVQSLLDIIDILLGRLGDDAPPIEDLEEAAEYLR